MDVFGLLISLTGLMLTLIGWKARPQVLAMLRVVLAAYTIGPAGIKINSAAYAPSQVNWGG
ncbi:MAG: hypothetical protein MUO62_06885 [Anaerolineales bacterium]|nr:hypothetical protein [Anaerolineales bacterium]